MGSVWQLAQHSSLRLPSLAPFSRLRRMNRAKLLRFLKHPWGILIVADEKERLTPNIPAMPFPEQRENPGFGVI